MKPTYAIVAAIAAFASALPSANANGNPPPSKGPSTSQVQKKCNAGSTVSCCNGGTALIGGNCSPVLLSDLIPIGSTCQGNNVVACCDGNTTGLIALNLCVPVNVNI